MPDESADDDEVQIHQGRWLQIRQLCVLKAGGLTSGDLLSVWNSGLREE